MCMTRQKKNENQFVDFLSSIKQTIAGKEIKIKKEKDKKAPQCRCLCLSIIVVTSKEGEREKKWSGTF